MESEIIDGDLVLISVVYPQSDLSFSCDNLLSLSQLMRKLFASLDGLFQRLKDAMSCDKCGSITRFTHQR